MIRRYVFGQPIPTGAVVRALPPERGEVPFFTTERLADGAVRFRVRLQAEDLLFGLGQSVRGINKRGHLYRSWNSDDFSHTENKQSLYQSHNLLLFIGPGRCFGIFLDDPGEVTWDLGFTRWDEAVITSLGGDFTLYLLQEESAAAICRAFRGLTGPSYVPPRWAMGYIQSRWGYASEEEVRRVVREHRQRGIPLDAVCMDIDYMERFKDFTWNRESFPDLPGLCASLREDHIRLVPIIDAGVRREKGYAVWEEGEQKGYFCKKADGSDFVAAVWPGPSCFPDFLRPEVRAWFGRQYHPMLDAGIEGFWNDMNEPALFYTPEGLEKAWGEVERLRGQVMEHDASFQLQAAFNGLANARADYERFYHTVAGRSVRHDRVHNLYGAAMTAAAAEGMRSHSPGKRRLLFSRSGFIGAHRDAGMWMGDNSSWWSHILLHLRMLPSLNMSGFLYCGADLGGFSCDTTEDLLLRWLQLGVFTPLMRNHSALHTRDQEIYRFSTWPWMRDTLQVRYALLPFLYSELMQAALTDGMLHRPLAFDYPEDPVACRTEDQVMLGRGCMIAPVYEQNALGRHVYLPEDMLLVRFRSAVDYDLLPMAAGHHWVELGLREFPLFIRRGCFIPLAEAAEYSEGVREDRLTLLGWLDGEAELSLYRDDGFTTAPDLAAGTETIRVRREGGAWRAEWAGGRAETGGIVCVFP